MPIERSKSGQIILKYQRISLNDQEKKATKAYELALNYDNGKLKCLNNKTKEWVDLSVVFKGEKGQKRILKVEQKFQEFLLHEHQASLAPKEPKILAEERSQNTTLEDLISVLAEMHAMIKNTSTLPFIRQYIKHPSRYIQYSLEFFLHIEAIIYDKLKLSEEQINLITRFLKKSLDYYSSDLSHQSQIYQICLCHFTLKLLKNNSFAHNPHFMAFYTEMNERGNQMRNQAHHVAVQLLEKVNNLRNRVNNLEDLKKRLPKNQQWRLAIDGCKQVDLSDETQGIIGYEKREKGSILGILRGYNYALSLALEENLTINLIKETHKQALLNVEGLRAKPGEFTRPIQFGLSLGEIAYDESKKFLKIKNGTVTFAGLVENYGINGSSLDESQSCVSSGDYTVDDMRFVVAMNNYSTPDEFVQKILTNYHQKMASLAPDNQLEKLKTIIEFFHTIEIYHPFGDGNARTFALILLNRELVKNGFPQTLLWNPNQIDMLSSEEFMVQVLQGMLDLQELIETGRYTYDTTPKDIQLEVNPGDYSFAHI